MYNSLQLVLPISVNATIALVGVLMKPLNFGLGLLNFGENGYKVMLNF